MTDHKKASHVVLTSHSNQVFKESIPIHWAEKDPKKRGPVIATISEKENRNAIGSHSGSYTVYRALSIASGAFPQDHKPDLENTEVTTKFGPYDSWYEPDRIVSMDPWGANIKEYFGEFLDKGYNIHPTVAVTQARLHIPEIREAIDKGRLPIDRNIVTDAKRQAVIFGRHVSRPLPFFSGVLKILCRPGIREAVLRVLLSGLRRFPPTPLHRAAGAFLT